MLRSRSRPGAPILPVLLLTLVLAGALAYQAYDAARSHRRASEAALRDYAAFAAWELGRAVAGDLSDHLSAVVLRARLAAELDGAAGEAAEDELARFAGRVREGLAWCGCAAAAHDFFLLDLGAGTVARRAERLPPEGEAWLREEVLARARRRAEATTARQTVQPARGGRGGGRRVASEVVQETRIFHPEGGAPGRSEVRVVSTAPAPYEVLRGPEGSGTVLFTLLPGARGGPARGYGFWLDAPAVVGPVVRRAVAQAPLLPPSLLRGAANREALALAAALDGAPLALGAAASPGPGGAVDTVHTALGRLAVHAEVRPEVAGRLLIGGLPRSRLPVLLGIFVLTLVLVGVAVLQLRRQQELIRLRSDFISGVSHELRTPLAQIRLFSDLLGSGRLSEGQRSRSVRIVGEEARRLTYLVENILHFSRSERRGSRVAPAPVEVAPLLREIVESFAPLARSRRVSLRVEAEEGVVAPLDRDAVRQVLLNLLDNALKYGPPEQVVTVGAEAEGDRVRIRVDDEGPGIPAAERARVWEPYRRLARDAESATGGSGIGLAVVRELVELHGGRVGVTDAPGGGARFVLELPLARAAGARAGSVEVGA